MAATSVAAMAGCEQVARTSEKTCRRAMTPKQDRRPLAAAGCRFFQGRTMRFPTVLLLGLTLGLGGCTFVSILKASTVSYRVVTGR